MLKGSAALAGVFAVTAGCWLASTPVIDTTRAGQVAQLSGGLALTGFALMMAIATRHRLLDWGFGGLDRAYVVHKWLGVGSLALVGLHLLSLPHQGGIERGHPSAPSQAGFHGAGQGAGHGTGTLGLGGLGGPSLFGFIAIALIALLATRLNYEIWKHVHKLVVIPYVFGLAHYYSSTSYGLWGDTAFSAWLNVINAAGLASAVYAVVLYERFAFRYPHTVVAVRAVGDGNLEITASPAGSRPRFRPGQFAFIKFPGLSFGSHPFTISSAPGDEAIQVTIRALGDHTSRLPGLVKPGDTMALAGPHGGFDFTTGTRQQVWIAAGIGITPFRSFLRAGVPSGHSIDLFYTYNGEQGAYLDELGSVPDNIRVHLIDSAEGDRLTADRILAATAWTDPVDVYFCGPHRLRKSLREGLRASRPPLAGFHFERFTFGRPLARRTRSRTPARRPRATSAA